MVLECLKVAPALKRLEILPAPDSRDFDRTLPDAHNLVCLLMECPDLRIVLRLDTHLHRQHHTDRLKVERENKSSTDLPSLFARLDVVDPE